VNKLVVPQSELNAGVDRVKFLKDAVLSVTTPSSRVEPWVGWLSRTFENPNFTPVDEQSQAIYCPVWLLNNRVAKCGQIARLAADGLSLVGIKVRVVQLSAHVVAEALQDGRWIMLDPNRLREGHAGHSVAELMRDEKRVDELLPHLKSREPVMKDDEARSQYKSYFAVRKFPGIPVPTPFEWKKTAKGKELDSHYFGWNYFVPAAIDGG
jgi:hypothetical protein